MLPIVSDMRAFNLSLTTNDSVVEFNTQSQRLAVQKNLPDSGLPPVGLELIICIYVSSALSHSAVETNEIVKDAKAQFLLSAIVSCSHLIAPRTRESVTCSRRLFQGLSPQ